MITQMKSNCPFTYFGPIDSGVVKQMECVINTTNCIRAAAMWTRRHSATKI